MKLDAGMYVNIAGRYDEETWEDQTTHEKKSAPVLIVEDMWQYIVLRVVTQLPKFDLKKFL